MKIRFVTNTVPAQPNSSPAARPVRALRQLALLCMLPMASLAWAQSSNSVQLAPGTCPEVRDGDIVTFTFTPQFDIPSAVAGLGDVELKFSHEGQAHAANAPEAEFTLHAARRRGDQEAPASAMVAGAAGSIEFHFRANLHSTARGRFFLVAVTGDPLLAPGYQGDTPKVINAPLRQHLCLQVIPLN